MKVHEISPLVSPRLAPWPGDTPFNSELVLAMSRGDSVNVSRVTLSSHFGAHADAPCHFVPGAADIATVALEPFLGPARVIQVPGVEVIGRREAALARGARRVLFRVLSEAADEFPARYAPLAVEAARELARLGVILFGTDAPSVDPPGSSALPAHHGLHDGGVAILENLRLSDVPAGEYELIALPLRWQGLDGSPVRAVLRELRGGAP